MHKLTARQQQILNLIREHIQEHSMPPTRAEIAKRLGFKSINAAEDHLRALDRKGAIILSSGTSRGIRLVEASDTTETHDTPSPVHTLSIPLVGRVAAGNPILATEHIESHIPIADYLFNPQPDYFLKVQGLSMKDIGIFEDDLLAVKKTSQARDGQIIVARIGDEVTVKRLRQHKDRIELLPENRDFSPIIVTANSDEFSIEGIAVGLLRANMLNH